MIISLEVLRGGSGANIYTIGMKKWSEINERKKSKENTM